MRRILTSCALVAMLTTGCAMRTIHWSKPDATAQDAARDRYECSRDSQQTWQAGGSGLLGLALMAAAAADAQERADQIFAMCMSARGWTGREIVTK